MEKKFENLLISYLSVTFSDFNFVHIFMKIKNV